MSPVTLRDLYLTELNDLYDAEHQMLRELPLLAADASSDELRETFDRHYVQTLRHVERLEALFRYLDERPRQAHCRPLRVIIEDARQKHARVDRGRALDAALIAEAQRMEHFEIAAYRCARTYATSIADVGGARMLEETLEEENGMEARLGELMRTGGLVTASPLRTAS